MHRERPQWADVAAAGVFMAAVGALALGVFRDPLVPLVFATAAATAHVLVPRFLPACFFAAPAAVVLSVIYLSLTGQAGSMIGAFAILGVAYAFLVALAVGFPFVVVRRPGLVGALWRGEVSLARVYWLYGILLNGLLGCVALFIGSDVPATVGRVWWPMYAGYVCLVVVAVWRSAGRHVGSRVWARLARLVVLLDVIRFGVQLGAAVMPAVAVASLERRPLMTRFELNSTGSSYPVVTQLHGSLALHADSLVIDIDSGRFSLAPPSPFEDAVGGRTVTLAFGLGLQHGTVGWDFGHVSPTAARVAVTALQPGHTAPVGRLRFAIGQVSEVPLHDRWLIAVLRAEPGGTVTPADTLAGFACAEWNLRGPTPASRLRSAMMRTHYSRAC